MNSNYTYKNKKITEAQWLAECMCERKAIANNVQLPTQFWSKDPVWKKEWLKQCIMANRLLKKYSLQAILAALKNEKSSRTYSLGSKFLKPLIEIEQNKLDNLPKDQINQVDINELEKPIQNTSSNSVFSKLKDL